MGITDHIKQYKESCDRANLAFMEVVEGLKGKLKTYVLRQFPKSLNSSPSATTLVNEAFMETSQIIRNGQQEYLGLNQERLMGLLKIIAWRKWNDSRRGNNAIKRGIGKKSVGSSDETVARAADDAVDIAARNELAIIVMSLLIDEPREIDKIINLLGVGLNFSGRQIEEILRRANDNKRVISDTVIQKRIAKTKKRLRQKLEEIGQDEAVDD